MRMIPSSCSAVNTRSSTPALAQRYASGRPFPVFRKVGIHLAPAIMHRRNRFINAGGILYKIPIRERIQLDGLLHESEKKKSAV
jgi:hypothetical protein